MKQFKIGLQLYSVREEMAKDFEGTLKKVAEMGYEWLRHADNILRTHFTGILCRKFLSGRQNRIRKLQI